MFLCVSWLFTVSLAISESDVLRRCSYDSTLAVSDLKLANYFLSVLTRGTALDN